MGKILIIKGADFSGVAVGQVVTPSGEIDEIAWESYSYKQIFETNNMLGISAGFESGNLDPLGKNPAYKDTPVPTIVSDVKDSGNYSAKVFGTTSCQASQIPQKQIPIGTSIFLAVRVYCTRYSAGNLGVFMENRGALINTTNSGFETKVAEDTSTKLATLIVGSWSSANLDGYIDTPVVINKSIFNTPPSLEEFKVMYNKYVEIKKKQ